MVVWDKDVDSDYLILPSGGKAKRISSNIRTRRAPIRRGSEVPGVKLGGDIRLPDKHHRMKWEDARAAANIVQGILRCEHVARVQWAGSLRRHCDTVGDLDAVVSRRIKIDGVDFGYAEKEYWGATLMELTGDWKFNIAERKRAKDRGMLLNRYGLFAGRTPSSGEKPIAGQRESEIFHALDQDFIPPERRSYANRQESKPR